MSNQYEPWVSMGITELDYFKMRYLEQRTLVMKLEAILDEVERMGCIYKPTNLTGCAGCYVELNRPKDEVCATSIKQEKE